MSLMLLALAFQSGADDARNAARAIAKRRALRFPARKPPIPMR
jgi:hypothetical protein